MRSRAGRNCGPGDRQIHNGSRLFRPRPTRYHVASAPRCQLGIHNTSHSRFIQFAHPFNHFLHVTSYAAHCLIIRFAYPAPCQLANQPLALLPVPRPIALPDLAAPHLPPPSASALLLQLCIGHPRPLGGISTGTASSVG